MKKLLLAIALAIVLTINIASAVEVDCSVFDGFLPSGELELNQSCATSSQSLSTDSVLNCQGNTITSDNESASSILNAPTNSTIKNCNFINANNQAIIIPTNHNNTLITQNTFNNITCQDPANNPSSCRVIAIFDGGENNQIINNTFIESGRIETYQDKNNQINYNKIYNPRINAYTNTTFQSFHAGIINFGQNSTTNYNEYYLNQSVYGLIFSSFVNSSYRGVFVMGCTAIGNIINYNGLSLSNTGGDGQWQGTQQFANCTEVQIHNNTLITSLDISKYTSQPPINYTITGNNIKSGGVDIIITTAGYAGGDYFLIKNNNFTWQQNIGADFGQIIYRLQTRPDFTNRILVEFKDNQINQPFLLFSSIQQNNLAGQKSHVLIENNTIRNENNNLTDLYYGENYTITRFLTSKPDALQLQSTQGGNLTIKNNNIQHTMIFIVSQKTNVAYTNSTLEIQDNTINSTNGYQINAYSNNFQTTTYANANNNTYEGNKTLWIAPSTTGTKTNPLRIRQLERIDLFNQTTSLVISNNYTIHPRLLATNFTNFIIDSEGKTIEIVNLAYNNTINNTLITQPITLVLNSNQQNTTPLYVNATTFNTTELITNVNLNTITLAVWNENASINWTNTINLTTNGDLDNNIQLQNKTLSVQSGTAPNLNQPATITFYNTGITNLSNAYLYRDGTLCTNPTCQNATLTGDNYTAWVSGFSTYTLNETCPPSYTCNAYDSCQTNNLKNCTSVIDLNSCGIPYNPSNYTDFQTSCTYIPPTTNGTGYQAQYSTNDLTPAVYDFIVGVFVALAGLAVLIGLGIALKGFVLPNFPFMGESFFKKKK